MTTATKKKKKQTQLFDVNDPIYKTQGENITAYITKNALTRGIVELTGIAGACNIFVAHDKVYASGDWYREKCDAITDAFIRLEKEREAIYRKEQRLDALEAKLQKMQEELQKGAIAA